MTKAIVILVAAILLTATSCTFAPKVLIEKQYSYYGDSVQPASHKIKEQE